MEVGTDANRDSCSIILRLCQQDFLSLVLISNIPLKDVLQRSPVAVVVEIDFHECLRIGRKSAQHFHEILLLKSGRRPPLEDGEVYLL